jgi:hypothetical protein
VVLVPDPRAKHSAEDRALQERSAMTAYGMMEKLTWIDDAATGLRDALRDRAVKLPPGDALRKRAEALAADLDTFHASLVATSEGGWMSGEEQLREKLATLYGGINGYEGRPTKPQLDQLRVLGARLDKAAAHLEALAGTDLPAVNKGLAGRKLEPVALLTLEEWKKRQNG